jgi:UDPglucose--hexose-1-phosphate uridylyltransferase
VLHTSPCNDGSADAYYHWHIEIMPKLTKVAGFEWGSGFYINPTPPEEAARVLREVQLA